jgi:HEAT repeat protein
MRREERHHTGRVRRSTATVDSLEDKLEALVSEGDTLAEQAALALPDYGTSGRDALLDLCTSPNPEHRWWALRALSGFQDPLACQALQNALKDIDAGVRQCAALGLRLQPIPAAVPALIQNLADPDRLSAHLAADALIAIGTYAITALAKALESPRARVRVEAARALAGIHDARTIPPLFNALEDASSLVGYWAEQGLNRHGREIVYFTP